MLTDSLPSPCILVEKKILERNIQQMQSRADANQVSLRPHTKTHKSIFVALQQIEGGARGLTAAKLSEAEVYVHQGFDDVRLAYILIGETKYERALALMQKARISFCVDTEEGARAASAFFAAAGAEAEVLLEVDTGYGRCGVRWDQRQSVKFAQFVDQLPGLKLAGILTHAGQSYKGPASDEESLTEALVRVSQEERDRMLDFALQLHLADVSRAQPNAEAGMDDRFEISIGSTPSMRYFENTVQQGFTITEIRPGNYVFHDAIQEALGVATLQECALTVQTSIISKHRNPNGTERLFLDAGRKVFTSDTGYATDGYGILLYNARTMTRLPHAHITGLSEEHGWVRVPGGSTMDVGNTVRVVPNHACVVVNNQDQLYLVDGDQVINTLTVDARGKVW